MFISTEMKNILKKYFHQSDGSIYIICPFISSATLVEILGTSNSNPISIITSWRPDYLLSRISSPQLFLTCKENGITLYINDRLHAKLYSNSLTSAYIGSANITEKALNDDLNSNIELLFYLSSLTPDIRLWIINLISQSTLVTEELYLHYIKWVDNQQTIELNNYSEIQIPQSIKGTFLINQLPASIHPINIWNYISNPTSMDIDERIRAEQDIINYSITSASDRVTLINKIKENFFNHPFINKFLNIITIEGIRFGGVKEWIQKNCMDVPVPYRRELTSPVQILYNWIIDLYSDKYEIYQPSHSQILRKRLI